MSYIIAASLTVLIEGVFLYVAGQKEMRSVRGMVYIALVNILTNLTLNITVGILNRANLNINLAFWIYPFEAAVVCAEYLLYRAYFKPSRRLFVLTLAANALSYFTGVLIFGHVK